MTILIILLPSALEPLIDHSHGERLVGDATTMVICMKVGNERFNHDTARNVQDSEKSDIVMIVLHHLRKKYSSIFIPKITVTTATHMALPSHNDI